MSMVSEYASALRALAGGWVSAHERRLRRFDETGWQHYADVLSEAFVNAVDRRFYPGQDRATVIRFVASVRERYDHSGGDIDPTAAERLVWAALGERKPCR